MIKIYRVAIVGRLDHDDVVLETDHLAAVAEKDARIKETLNFADLERATYKGHIAERDARIEELEGLIPGTGL
jgi:hypothetical protein